MWMQLAVDYSSIMGHWTTKQSPILDPLALLTHRFLPYRVTSAPSKLRRIPSSGLSDLQRIQPFNTKTCPQRLLNNVACITEPSILLTPPWLVGTSAKE